MRGQGGEMATEPTLPCVPFGPRVPSSALWLLHVFWIASFHHYVSSGAKVPALKRTFMDYGAIRSPSYL